MEFCLNRLDPIFMIKIKEKSIKSLNWSNLAGFSTQILIPAPSSKPNSVCVCCHTIISDFATELNVIVLSAVSGEHLLSKMNKGNFPFKKMLKPLIHSSKLTPFALSALKNLR